MDTLEKHNKEIGEKFEKEFLTTPEGHILILASLPKTEQNVYNKLKSFITSQNNELLKKIAKEHFTEVNRILNLHSKTISEGGLDYKKAFEEMENYENKLAQVLEDLEK